MFKSFLTLFSALACLGAWAEGENKQVINLTDSLGKEYYYVNVQVPDGNYRVTVELGCKKFAGSTTVRAENRRLFIENEVTKKGETKSVSFLVNKRTPEIPGGGSVRIKERERAYPNWDDYLTLEITGDRQAVTEVTIEPDHEAPTVFLCGNSTVVDQPDEPWASWGQMITRWFTDSVCFCNMAESGETASTFISVGRLEKALSMMKEGDYIIMEFGHNDQKQKQPGSGAYYNFATALKTFVDEARARGAQPIFITPTQRRAFDSEGRIQETHGDYPEAMKWVAEREGCPLIDLHEMTRELFETMGVEGTKRAFVHYPANTFPGQETALADNTHFNPYGAYEIAKCVTVGLLAKGIGFTKYLRTEFPRGYSPLQPDDPDAFHWVPSHSTDTLKPDGN
ncbi:MAG: rhamnogalacturonan acetylesterase [Prevotellaceae bacterium]|nr:rhamnogalacturonan acetylesterase [Prevotellaceae bacterium]